MVFLRGLPVGTVHVSTEPNSSVESFKILVEEQSCVPRCHWHLIYSGRPLQDGKQLQHYGVTTDSTIQLAFRLLGGKGGFGSLLRGAGRAILTDNVDACRDLSGRRLRQANAEKRLAQWAAEARERELEKIAMKHVREQEKANKREERAQIDSEAVRREQQEALARVSAAVIAAQEILAGGTLESGKRKASMQVTDKPAKRARIFGLEELSDSETDSEDDEEIAMFEKAGQLAAAGSSGLDSSASDYEAAPSLRQTSPVGTSAAKTVLSDPHMAEPLHEPQPGKTAAFPLLDKANAPQHSAQPLLSGVASPHTTAASPSQATVLQSANAAQHAESPLTPASTSSPSMAQEAHGDISTGAEKQATVATAPVKAQAASAPADSIHQQHTVAVTASGTSAAGKSAASKASQQQEPIDLANFDNAAQLEGVGMERLKAELQRHGMKCGGTVQERASRLLLLKEKSVQDIDRKHLAKQ